VASYHWSFGDGSSLTTTSATASHTYKHAGKHKVTLTVTDDSGCSTTQVFTGQTAYCNGTSAAKISHTVKIAAAKTPLKLSVSPKSAKAAQSTCYAFNATSEGHGVKKVTVKLAGHTATTSGSGNATLCLTLSKGTYRARASKDGYTVADARITVSAASPVFTG
jgi:PKD repeat protein